MKIKDILKNNEKGIAFEFFPPRTARGREAFKKTIGILKLYRPLYVSMTYGAAGQTRRYSRDAVGTLLEEKGFTVMPHLTCVGSSRAEIRSILDDYKAKGIKNIMALRGDPPQGESGFDFKSQDFAYAKDLVAFIKANYDFCVGVAVYPEGHIETSSLAQDLDYTRQKIDAGADFAVTQMFFDNRYYYDFMDRAQKAGINIPILPGILPLTDISKVEDMASVCRTTIPAGIAAKMDAFKNNPEDMTKVGIDFTIAQCRALAEHGFKKLHFFTLNKPSVIGRILKRS